MCLPARQQRALDAIESALEARDAHMAGMFAMFTRLTRGEEPTDIESLSRRSNPRWRPVLLLLIPVVSVMVLLTGLAVAVVTGGASACTSAYARPGLQPAVSCVARPLPVAK